MEEHENLNVTAARLGLKGLVGEKGPKYISDHQIPEVVKEMIKWLSEIQNTDWLLIFDNYDDLDEFNLLEYVPKAGWGSILVTSRRHRLKSPGVVLEMPDMSPDEGLSLLAKRSGFNRNFTSSEQQIALKLLDRFEFLPLAI
ncbi:hypothetical protein F4777DRAFT_601293 [Nemania sp. FL0916]|nr:hypothetical protein F4777DRAFT_601293 [Nemania sp. FL0916]